MGCSSGKAVPVAARKSHGCVAGQSRSATLLPLDVQVVKPPNARREVFAAPDQDRQLPLPHLRQEGGIMLELERVDVALEQVAGPLASSPVQEPLQERGDLLLPDPRDEAQPVSPWVSPPPKTELSGGRPWRMRSLMCDCCDDVPDHHPKGQRKRARGAEPGPQLETLIEELFRAQDLKSDGMLDEDELVELNQAVAGVHDSRDGQESPDKMQSVQRKYSNLFRENFDSEGRPVPYARFRSYMLEVLDQIDRNEEAQEMMVEQFLAEARLARTVVTGAPIMVDLPRAPTGGVYNSCLRFCPASEQATQFCR